MIFLAESRLAKKLEKKISKISDMSTKYQKFPIFWKNFESEWHVRVGWENRQNISNILEISPIFCRYFEKHGRIDLAVQILS